MMQKIRNWLYRFMYGRNGSDSLCRALMIPFVVIVLISVFLTGTAKSICNLLSLILVIYIDFRMFSKNISKRQKENAWFESKKNYYQLRLKQAKDYKFFNCPNCGTHLRVPRGVGKITITCKKCGTKFDRKA